jgi:ferredoxin
MKAIIEIELCCGHGRCYQVASELFADDERGYVQVIGDGTVTADQLEVARRAIAACPEGAIRLLEE